MNNTSNRRKTIVPVSLDTEQMELPTGLHLQHFSSSSPVVDPISSVGPFPAAQPTPAQPQLKNPSISSIYEVLDFFKSQFQLNRTLNHLDVSSIIQNCELGPQLGVPTGSKTVLSSSSTSNEGRVAINSPQTSQTADNSVGSHMEDTPNESIMRSDMMTDPTKLILHIKSWVSHYEQTYDIYYELLFTMLAGQVPWSTMRCVFPKSIGVVSDADWDYTFSTINNWVSRLKFTPNNNITHVPQVQSQSQVINAVIRDEIVAHARACFSQYETFSNYHRTGHYNAAHEVLINSNRYNIESHRIRFWEEICRLKFTDDYASLPHNVTQVQDYYSTFLCQQAGILRSTEHELNLINIALIAEATAVYNSVEWIPECESFQAFVLIMLRRANLLNIRYTEESWCKFIYQACHASPHMKEAARIAFTEGQFVSIGQEYYPTIAALTRFFSQFPQARECSGHYLFTDPASNNTRHPHNRPSSLTPSSSPSVPSSSTSSPSFSRSRQDRPYPGNTSTVASNSAPSRPPYSISMPQVNNHSVDTNQGASKTKSFGRTFNTPGYHPHTQ